MPDVDNEITVRWIDAFNGMVVKVEKLNKGDNATPLENIADIEAVELKNPKLLFDGFTHTEAQYTNLQHNLDIGIQRKVADGKTWVYLTLTQVTGKDVPIYFSKNDESTLEIDFMDGSPVYSTNESGYLNITHSFPNLGKVAFTMCMTNGKGAFSFGNGNSFIGGSNTVYRKTLDNIFAGNGITSIEVSAFSNCTSLTSIVLPEGITSIERIAFSYCTSLTSIVLPEGITLIGGGAFKNCTSLTSIVLPEGITSIEGGAFSDCTSLTQYAILATTVPTNTNAFYGINSQTRIYVPAASLDAYKTATNWSAYANYIYADTPENRALFGDN